MLNPLLRAEIEASAGRSLEVHCFSSLLTGLKHFGEHAGVTAKKLPTETQSLEIKNEIDMFPFIQYRPEVNNAWLISQGNESQIAAAINSLGFNRRFAAIHGGFAADTPLPLRVAREDETNE